MNDMNLRENTMQVEEEEFQYELIYPGIQKEDTKLKGIDLFCGIGGFRLAMQNNGIDCIFSCLLYTSRCV